jgi:hypothetical protein
MGVDEASMIGRITGELREWIADWRAGLFDSNSRDEHGWPIEMHGIVADLESLLVRVEALERVAEAARPFMGMTHGDGKEARALRDALAALAREEEA